MLPDLFQTNIIFHFLFTTCEHHNRSKAFYKELTACVSSTVIYKTIASSEKANKEPPCVYSVLVALQIKI